MSLSHFVCRILTTENVPMILGGIFVVYIAHCFYRYWKFRHSFGDIPMYNAEFHVFRTLSTGKIPKDVPFTSFLYQEILSMMKPFEKEGIVLLWLFQPILFLLDDKYTKVFSTERATAGKAPFVYRILQEMIGKGLVTTNAENWKHQRKTLNPAFRVDLLKGNTALINEGAKIMVKNLEEVCNKPTEEVVNILKLGSLKILCGSMLGLKVNSEEHDSKMRRYLELLDTLAAYTMYRLPRPWLYWRKMSMLFPSGRKHRNLYKEFHQFTNNFVRQMVDSYLPINFKNTDEDSELYGGGKQFVRLLLDTYSQDPSFTLQNVQDEVASIIFGGHDTTAYTLLWSLYLLGLNPAAQKKAFEEAESVIENGTDYSFADVNKLSYIECVIKESLRIYPTVPLFGRMIDKDVECGQGERYYSENSFFKFNLGACLFVKSLETLLEITTRDSVPGKFKVLKGTVIIFAPYILHRNPEYFPDPEKFDPERYSGNEVKHWTYIPFSEGMRSCIGKKYGMLVMKIVLAHILRTFEITSLDKREEIRVDWHILLTPTRPLRFQLTPRKSSNLRKR